jgi:hypothetical protein
MTKPQRVALLGVVTALLTAVAAFFPEYAAYATIVAGLLGSPVVAALKK